LIRGGEIYETLRGAVHTRPAQVDAVDDVVAGDEIVLEEA
jgi:hypothetical protein